MQENGIQLVSGQNCSPQFAVQEFMATWQMHHKKSPGWFYHYVQSCHPDEPITGEQAHTIEKDFAAQAWPDSRKNITHTTPSGRKCRDDRLHEEKYLKESMEQEFEQRRKIVFERTEAAQYANRTAAAGAEYTGASHAGRVDTVTGSAVWTVRPASGATSLGKTSADPLRNAGADAGAEPGNGTAADGGRTGWETEREVFLSSKNTPAGASVPSVVAGASADLGGLVGDVVQLGYHMERLQPAAPMTPLHSHSEHKQLAKERQKKIAQGHAENDQEDEQNNKYQQTM